MPPQWIWLHIPFLLAAIVLFLAAATASFLFLVQERRIKTHDALAVSSRLPSLETLDKFIYRMIAISFPLLTLGLLLGGHWAVFTRKSYWGADPAETLSFLTWGLYAVYLMTRWWLGWRGRRSTYLALIGFSVILITLIVLPFFSPLHHGRGGV